MQRSGPAVVRQVGGPAIPFDKMTPAEQISEAFYLHAVEVTKPAFMAINRAYPQEERASSPKIEYRFAEAHRQARQHLNFHKKAVRDFIDVFCLVKRHSGPYDANGDVPTTQMRAILDKQLITLHRRLTDFAPLLLPEEDVPSFLTVLNARAETERAALAKELTPYEIDPRLKDYKEE